MVIDHIGIAVKSIPEGISLWERLFGYKQMTEVVENTRQKVKVVFMKKENSTLVKLIEPVDDTSPAFKMAKSGGGIHHICFRCDDVKTAVADLKAQGARVLAEPQPGEAFDNEDIAFVYVRQGINVELIDAEKKVVLE